MTRKLLTLIGIAIILMATPVRAEITPQLLQEWGRQPSNVQWNLYNQRTNIQVVDKLPWTSSNLYETYAYTTMNVQGGYVQSIDMVIKCGYESALTHEVGHCISNYNGVRIIGVILQISNVYGKQKNITMRCWWARVKMI